MNETLTIERSPEDFDDVWRVHRAQSGDIGAFEALIRCYYARIYGFVYGMTANRDESEALVQEVFIKAWKAIGYFHEQSIFRIWIFRIALACLTGLRRRKIGRKSFSLDEFDPGVKKTEFYRALTRKGSVLRKTSLSEFQHKMNTALLRLPAKLRAMVILYDVQGMSYPDMAEVIRGSEAAVDSRLTRAHALLQTDLAEFKDSESNASGTGVESLLALKAYEIPEQERVERTIQDTLRIVRETSNIPSLLIFPDTSFAWMFTKPRYGVALLFIAFLAMHMMKRPVPETVQGPLAVVRSEDDKLLLLIDTNRTGMAFPFRTDDPFLFDDRPDPFVSP